MIIKSNLLRAIIFILIPIIAIAMIQILPPQFDETYGAAIFDKIDYLSNLSSPKIILCGGSDVCFGFDSGEIEREMMMPCANLGLLGGIDIEFYMNIAREYVAEGDIVILSIAYPAYNGLGFAGEHYLEMFENNLDMYRFVPLDHLLMVAHDIPLYSVKKMRYFLSGTKPVHYKDPQYIRENFNEHGDIVFKRESNIIPDKGYFNDKNLINGSTLSEKVTEQINQFNSYCESKGAKVYISFPPKIRDSVRSPKSDLNDFVNSLNQNLEPKIISEIHDYLLEKELFYDTNYHLNDTGVIYRTSQFIKDLKAVQQLMYRG